MIVTIDGPAGSGKSTAAHQLAERLQFEFLDTGAMYRGVAWYCLEHDIDLHDADALQAAADRQQMAFNAEGRLLSNGQDITQYLRTAEVTAAASIVATNNSVRSKLVELQQLFAEGKNIVSEGRDQGTVVFPHAECKFFLTASLEARAKRRQQEMQAEGNKVDLEDILQQLKERDERDQNRTIAPLQPASDATVIDTSNMSIDKVLDLLEQQVKAKMN